MTKERATDQPTSTPPYLTHPLLDCPGVRHGFFTRMGGVSHGLYDSLNGGLGSDDHRNHVHENRHLAQSAIGGGDDQLCGLFQIHSDQCHIVDHHALSNQPIPERKEGDALVTANTGLTCVILTADCVPVLCVDPVNHVIGAAHAGWRGAVGGIIASTITAMEDQGASRNHIRAVTGPSIQQASYQVGQDLKDAVCATSPPANSPAKSNAAQFFIPDQKKDHWLFDLPGYVLGQLHDLGVNAASMPEDTYADDRFFSHRRATHQNQPDSGRLMAMIRLTHSSK